MPRERNNAMPNRPWRSAALAAIVTGAMLLAPSPTFADGPADRQFKFAYVLLQRGEIDQARTEFDQFLESFPRDDRRGDALYYRALLARRTGDVATASRLLSDVPETTMVPAYAVKLLRGQVAYDQGDAQAALTAIESVDLAPLPPAIKASVLMLKGLSYRAANNPAGAAEAFEQAVAYDTPIKASALLQLGRTRVALDQDEAALQSLTAATASKDARVVPDAARLAGDVAYDMGQYDRAIQHYQQVITDYQSSPHFGPAVVGVMWSQLQKGDMQAVLQTHKQFAAALQAESGARAAYLAGSAQQSLGNHEEAVQQFARIVRSADAVGLGDKVLYKAALSQFELKQYASVREMVELLEKTYPQSSLKPDAAFLLAMADAAAADAGSGAAQFNAIVEAGPKHPYFGQAVLRRARLHEKAGDIAAAAADYLAYRDALAAGQITSAGETVERAGLRLVDLYDSLDELDKAQAAADWLVKRDNLPAPIAQEAYFRRAVVQVKAKNQDAALASLNTLLEKFPTTAYAGPAHYYRGLLLMSKGNTDEAANALRSAVATQSLSTAEQINAQKLLAAHARDAHDDAAAVAALMAVEKLTEGKGLSPQDRLFLAQHYLDFGKQPKAALAYLAPLVQDDADYPRPIRAEAVYRAGLALRALDDLAPATEAFRQVVALGEPWDMQARLELAATLRDRGQLEDAKREYVSLVNHDDAAVASEAVYQLGRVHRLEAERAKLAGDAAAQQKALGEARAMFKRVTILFAGPEHTPLPQLAYLELAEVEADQNNTEAALAALRELIDKYTAEGFVWYARAREAELQSKPQQVKFYLEKLRAMPNVPARLQERIDALAKRAAG